MSTETTLDRQTRELVDAIAKTLTTEQLSTGQRDLGQDVAVSPGQAASEEQQRFFGSIIQSFAKFVVPTVAPAILGLLQQRRRDLGIPEQRDAEAVSRDFGAILGALLPKLLDAVPGIVSALQGRPAPRSVEEENERFLPFLAAVIPALVSAAPSIIGLFNKQRGLDGTPPAISDPDVSERFLGSLLSAVVPTILQAAPSILDSLFGGRLDLDVSFG